MLFGEIVVPVMNTAFALNEHLVAQRRGEKFPEVFFRSSAHINIGKIEVVDALFQTSAHQLLAVLHPEAAHAGTT